MRYNKTIVKDILYIFFILFIKKLYLIDTSYGLIKYVFLLLLTINIGTSFKNLISWYLWTKENSIRVKMLKRIRQVYICTRGAI